MGEKHTKKKQKQKNDLYNTFRFLYFSEKAIKSPEGILKKKEKEFIWW